MKKIFYSLRTMMNAKWSNTIKIISASLGLMASIVLFSFDAYIHSYDKGYKDYQNLYQLWVQYTFNGIENNLSEKCLGKLAGGLLEDMPDVLESAATSVNWGNQTLMRNGREFESNLIIADSLFFKTMGIEVVQGNAIQDMAQSNALYLSEELAKEMFGNENPVGQSVKRGTTDLMVRGVYKSIQKPTTYYHTAILSMPTIWGKWGNYSWNGGDSWNEYVRLKDDVTISLDELNRRANQVLQTHVPDTESVQLKVFIKPLTDTYFQSKEAQRENIAINVLAILLLSTTILNYILITLSSLGKRAKAIGIHKCNGASDWSILSMFLWETAIIMGISIVLISGGLLLFGDKLSSIPLNELFGSGRWIIIVGIFLIFFLLGGFVPGRVFSRVPVSHVFRKFTDNKKTWKHTLLFVEFASAGLIFGVLCVSSTQYSYVLNKAVGYDSAHLVVVSINDNNTSYKAYTDWLSTRPYVKDVTTCSTVPAWGGYSGALIKDDSGVTFFSTRYDHVWPNYLDVYDIPLLEGKLPSTENEVVVNEEFVREMRWNDSAIGRVLKDTEFGTLTVTGVCRDFHIGNYFRPQMPIMLLPILNGYFNYDLVINIKDPVSANCKLLAEESSEAFPAAKISFTKVSDIIYDSYESVRKFCNSVVIVTIIIFIITLIGLIGFVSNETQRRSKEMAIRKVNGAHASDVIELFIANIMKLAIPAVILGTIAAWGVIRILIDLFSTTSEYLTAAYGLSCIGVLIFIALGVIVQTWRMAHSNPVESLKSE